MVFHTLGAVKNAIGIGHREPELRIKTEMRLTRSCQCIIATTERERADLIQHYGALPEGISVIPCGVNLDLFQPLDREIARRQLGFGRGRNLLFVGRIEPLKGVDRLLRAMTYLHHGQQIGAVIIGGDGNSHSEVGRLRKLSRELNIAESVTFLGVIEQERLPWFYSAATACVIPSYYESFGLVALESIACGTPVVATDVGDLGRIIQPGETGYVVPDGSPRSLAQKIAMLLSHLDTNSALSIRASVTRFSWSNIARQIISRVLADYLCPRHRWYQLNRQDIACSTEGQNDD